MKLVTENDFINFLKTETSDYYKGRWEYFKEVIRIIKNESIKNAIELGPGTFKIIKDCDIMVKPEDDCWGQPKSKIGKVFYHNATEKPWPIKDKEYDLFLALQVWEHLDNKQSRAFREVMRISRMAILSFP